MKKTLALLLSALLLALGLPLAAFAEGTACGCDKAPRIMIDGINACALYRDYGTENQTEAFRLSPEAIVDTVKENAGAVWDALDGRFSVENEAQIVNAVISMFSDCSMEPDGTSRYEITPDWSYATEDIHKDGGIYSFKYDWRLDPFEIADQLHDYVEYIKNLTGHDTVHLIGFSLGTVMLDAYLTVYGYEGLESCLWFCSAHDGVELVGELFTGRMALDAAAVNGYMYENTENSFGFELLSALLDGLKNVGITDGVFRIANKVLDTLTERGGMREILLGTFARMPAIWAFVDDPCYEEAKDWLFPTAADREYYAALIEKIDRYHYGVQQHVDEIMETARLTTDRIGVLSKYGRYMTPVVEGSDICADGVIDTPHTSGGATVARLGKTLGDGYVQAVNDGHNHLSADGMIDASTCRYPEYTWFIKNCEHSEGLPYFNALLDFLCFSEEQPTVFTDPAFPQFVVFDRADRSVSPLTDDRDGLKDQKFVVRVHAFFSRILAFLRRLFTGRFF